MAVVLFSSLLLVVCVAKCAKERVQRCVYTMMQAFTWDFYLGLVAILGVKENDFGILWKVEFFGTSHKKELKVETQHSRVNFSFVAT